MPISPTGGPEPLEPVQSQQFEKLQDSGKLSPSQASKLEKVLLMHQLLMSTLKDIQKAQHLFKQK